MTLAVLFLIVFLAGPYGFRLMTRAAPSRGNFRLLGALTAACAAAGLLVRYLLPVGGAPGIWVVAGAIALIWIAWIAVLALGAQALRRAEPSDRMYRWTGVIGAAGTTVPWFGLAWANLIAGPPVS